MDGNGIRKFTDGIINVQDGKGIAHSIKTELGLTQTQFNKCIGGIFDIVREQQNAYKAANESGTGDGYNLFLKGDKLDGSSRDNFVVQKGHVLKFTQELWQKLIDFVNRTLGLEGEDALKYGKDDQAPSTSSSSDTDTPTSTQLTTEQTTAINTAQTLMGNALKPNATINKQERKNGETLQGYIYSYGEANGEDVPINTVYVNTDANGKLTKVIIMTPDADDGTVTTEYDLENNTMQVGDAEAITLDDTQLATIKEKAFLIANDKQLDDAKKAVSAIVADLESESSYVDQHLEISGAGALRLKLSDGRQVNVELDSNNQIIGISFIPDNNNSRDYYMDVILYRDGKITADRDTQWDTTQNNQSIIQADAKLFNELKNQLQPLLDVRTNKIANLRTPADEKFTNDNEQYFNRVEETIAQFENLAGVDDTPNVGKNLDAITKNATWAKNMGNNTKQYWLNIEGRVLGVNIQTVDGTSKITGIFINNDRDLGIVSDFHLYDTGKIWIDKDMKSDDETGATTNDQVSHIYSNTNHFDQLKARVIRILKAKYPDTFANLT